jgi:hypothetical protein
VTAIFFSCFNRAIAAVEAELVKRFLRWFLTEKKEENIKIKKKLNFLKTLPELSLSIR